MANSSKPRSTYETLAEKYGFVMDASALRHVFSFDTQSGLRSAIARGALPVKTFLLPGRKGPFAMTEDIAGWLDDLKKGQRGNPVPVVTAKSIQKSSLTRRLKGGA